MYVYVVDSVLERLQSSCLSLQVPNLESLQTPIFPSNNPTFLENSTLKWFVLFMTGEDKSSSPTSNFP